VPREAAHVHCAPPDAGAVLLLEDEARSERLSVLSRLGGDGEACARVLAYCESPFRDIATDLRPVFPLPSEPHVDTWRRYVAESGSDVFGYLQRRLPQLGVPIREGISKTDAYRAVARRGEPCRPDTFGELLTLERPGSLRLYVHEHPAGALPILVTDWREDFERLSRCLACRSEPEPIAPSVNAQMIAGFVNWDRVDEYRRGWLDAGNAPPGWPGEMSRLAREEKWRFQDRFVLTCAQPYSSVSAAELGLAMDEAEWLQRSTELRVEHEMTHYATRRAFGVMRLNLLDETLCDFMGTTFALGEFRAEWFLRFLGLESWPSVRESGRIHTYREDLEGAAFELLCAVTVGAARGLERLATARYAPEQRARFLLALAPLTLELLASERLEEAFSESSRRAAELLEPIRH